MIGGVGGDDSMRQRLHDHGTAVPPCKSPRASVWSIVVFGVGIALARLAKFDLAVVRLISIGAQPRLFRLSAVAFSRLGNGGIYALLPLIVFARLGRQGFEVIAIAVCNTAFLHVFYPVVKRRVHRRRPFRIDHTLPSLLNVLDEHSFPSGHVMTLTATLVPIVYADPGSTGCLTALLGAMAWARIASGHHYASDVLGGAVFACATGYPLTLAWFRIL